MCIRDSPYTHTHTLESNPGKTRKNATLENAGPKEITEACRQTAGAPTRGIRLQTSKHLTERKIGITLTSALRKHAHARCPAAILSQHGTAHASAGTGPTPAIRGKGGRDGRRGPVRQRYRTRAQPREKTTKCRGPTENNKDIAERRHTHTHTHTLATHTHTHRRAHLRSPEKLVRTCRYRNRASCRKWSEKILVPKSGRSVCPAVGKPGTST